MYVSYSSTPNTKKENKLMLCYNSQGWRGLGFSKRGLWFYIKFSSELVEEQRKRSSLSTFPNTTQVPTLLNSHTSLLEVTLLYKYFTYSKHSSISSSLLYYFIYFHSCHHDEMNISWEPIRPT